MCSSDLAMYPPMLAVDSVINAEMPPLRILKGCDHPDHADGVVPTTTAARRRWGLLAAHHHQCLGVALLGEERNRSMEMVSGER